MTPISEAPGVPKKIRGILADAGIATMERLLATTLDELAELEGIGDKALIQVMKARETWAVSAEEQAEEKEQARARGDAGYNLEEPPEDARTVTWEEFTVRLQARHAAWVHAAAELYGHDPAHVIEQCVRQGMARDPYKAGTTAESGTVLKHDNPFATKD